MASLFHLSCTSFLLDSFPRCRSPRSPRGAPCSIPVPPLCRKASCSSTRHLPRGGWRACGSVHAGRVLEEGRAGVVGGAEFNGEAEFLGHEKGKDGLGSGKGGEQGQGECEGELVRGCRGQGRDQGETEADGKDDHDEDERCGGGEGQGEAEAEGKVDGGDGLDEERSSPGDGVSCERRMTKSEHVIAECRVETVSWRERFVKASILVKAAPFTVWKVLTDYEKLSDFIPNLVSSEKIPCPYPGRIWLLQRGVQRTIYWNIEAHVILDLQEFPDVKTGSELHFSMVDGDFKRYHGKWYLRNGPRPGTTMLHYEVNVVPKLVFPAAFVENIVKEDLPKNLSAIAERAEIEAEGGGEVLSALKMLKASDEVSTSNYAAPTSSSENIHTNRLNPAVITKVEKNGGRVTSSSSTESNDIINVGAPYFWSGFGRTCQLTEQRFIDEIHFRRVDDALEKGVVHRQVVATVTVKAPAKDVWAVLTAYEALPEFIPNLTKSVVLSRDKESVQLLQEGCKRLLYVNLHARVVLDLLERPEQEISFTQAEGDFDSFEGNWMLNQFGSRHTVLKYTVDMRIRKDFVLSESIVEEIIYEDLPSNLCAIRDRAENLWTVENSSAISPGDATVDGGKLCGSQQTEGNNDCTVPTKLEMVDNTVDNLNGGKLKAAQRKSRKKRINCRKLMTDYGFLEMEIRRFIAAYGIEGVMPLRKHMRQHGRGDLEKAVTSMGGFRTIALRMKLSLAYKERKPDGYWDDVQNLRNEVIAVQKELGGDPTVLPSRLSIEKLGHYHLARALEKWGGAKETAKILGLKTQRMQNLEQQMKEKTALDESESTAVPIKPALGITMKENNLELTGTVVDDPSVAHSKRNEYAAATQVKDNSLEDTDICISSSIAKDISNEPLLKDTSCPLDCDEPSHLSDLDLSSPNDCKQKKMPYKTSVPHESSKWLALFRDGTS